MNSPLKVVVLSASPNTLSTSVTLADYAVAALRRRYDDADVTRVDVYHLGPGLTSAVTRTDVDAATEKALEAVEDSDLLVVSVPTYRGSYPGMFKHFMDIVRQRPFDRKPVLLMATGGSPRHMLMIDPAIPQRIDRALDDLVPLLGSNGTDRHAADEAKEPVRTSDGGHPSGRSLA